MNASKFFPVAKRRFNLHRMDHRRGTLQTLIRRYHLSACLHQVGHRAAIARAFDHEIGNQRDGLGMIQLDAARHTAPRHQGCHRNQQLVLFTRGKVHSIFAISARRAGPFAQIAAPSKPAIPAAARASRLAPSVAGSTCHPNPTPHP